MLVTNTSTDSIQWDNLDIYDKSRYNYKTVKKEIILSDLSNKDLFDMNNDTKSKMTYKQIMEVTGLTRGQVAGRIRQYKIGNNSKIETVGSKGSTQVGNTRTIFQKNMPIVGLKELYKLHSININEWRLDKSVVNFWGSARNPNTQVKAWLTPLRPEAIYPVVSPIEIKMGRAIKVKNFQRPFERLLFLPDAHTGFERDLRTGKLTEYHDRAAMEVAVQVASATQPDVIVLSGDWADFAEVSDKFPRTPQCEQIVQPTIIELVWWLAQLRIVCPNARIVYIEGNHEHRLPKLLAKHLPWAYDLTSVEDLDGHPALSVPSLLGLDALNIEWLGGYPKNKLVLSPSLVVTHGNKTRAGAGNTVRYTIKNRQYTEVYGHLHRAEMTSKTVHDMEGNQHYITAISSGLLGHIDGRIPGGSDEYDWQQAFTIVDYTKDWAQPYLTYIKDGMALLNGVWYKAGGVKSLIKAATNLNI